jgi:hypothetical protein
MNRPYLIFGSLLLLGWSYVDVRGREFFTEPTAVIPAEVARGPGGYRSFHFWHYGFQGGK